jgi:histidyl-tRNA synthetase
MNNKTQTLKGFRDFLPRESRVRNYVKNILTETFINFGFQPLETPALEYKSTLVGKSGSETDKLLYSFTDKGDRQIGLRYDLTVPAAKVLAIYQNEITLPFKRFQIQPVWRADKPQKGRYREFVQSDIDIYGSSSPLAEAEIVAIIYQALTKLNFKKFQIKLNSRIVLSQIITQSSIKTDKNTVLQSLDKLDKIGNNGVKDELISKGLSSTQIDSLFDYIKKAQPDDYLKQVIDAISQLGVPQDYYSFSPTLVRGLDYYTGPIFETFIEDSNIGAIGGGGRYDDLIKSLGGPDIPAVGYAFGFERLVDVINELNLLPQLSQSATKIMIANFDSETLPQSLKLASFLRQNNLNTFFYPNPDKIAKQFKYADSQKIPFVVIIGSDEAKNNQVTLKNMQTREQKTITPEELLQILC